MTLFVPDNELYDRLRDVLSRGWVEIPDTPGYGGSGAPGKLLEELLGISGQNYSIPDAGQWELKFHSRSALMTLFHLEAKPDGYMHGLLREFGWPGKEGQTNFRHTLKGKSERGFYVVNEDSLIVVKNVDERKVDWPRWTHDQLLNAFAGKMRRLMAVRGTVSKGHVRYLIADLYREPQITRFIDAIVKGIVAIDFDARTTAGRGLRNHWTKFRVSPEDLPKLYTYHERFE